MQKGRILLVLFSFPLITILLITFIIFTYSGNKQTEEKVLGVAHAKVISYTPPSIRAKIKTTILPTRVPTLTPTKIPTPFPTQNLQPTSKPIPTEIPKIIAQSTSPTDYILQKVNEYRASKGQPKVTANTETCNFAKTRAEEISTLATFNHDGFKKRVDEKTLPYPTYSEVTENIAYNTDFTDVVNRWIASPGHEANMRKNTQYVCIGKYGDYYTYEGWQP